MQMTKEEIIKPTAISDQCWEALKPHMPLLKIMGLGLVPVNLNSMTLNLAEACVRLVCGEAMLRQARLEQGEPANGE